MRNSKCDCINGFRRNSIGVCIPEKQCPNSGCTGNYEAISTFYNICTARTCANLNPPRRICTEAYTQNVCDCVQGYLRNACGNCVTADRCSNDCNSERKCNIYRMEEPRCINSCSEQTCENANSPYLRKCISNCTESCDCIYGYGRNKCGECVPKNNCDQSCFIKLYKSFY